MLRGKNAKFLAKLMTAITGIAAILASLTLEPAAVLIAVPFGAIALLLWVYYAWRTELIDELWISGGIALTALISIWWTSQRGIGSIFQIFVLLGAGYVFLKNLASDETSSG